MVKLKRRITFNSPVVLSFLAICLLATLLGQLTGDKSTYAVFMTYRSSLLSPMTYVRLFTHVFGHAGWSHFIGNSTYILLLGPMLEEKYGSKEMVEIIAVTAVVTGLVNAIFFPHVALCGASGVCFAFILLTSLVSFKEGELPLTFILVVIFFLGQQVYDMFFVEDNVSNLSHILGGIVGSASGFVLNSGKGKGKAS